MARTIAKDHDQKRQQILHTAARVFADKGVDRASMMQVAEACRISKANIYHYYSSKNALLFDILDSHLRGLRDRVSAVDVSSLTPQDHFHAVVLEILLAYQGADNEHKIQAAGMESLDAGQQKILRGYQRDLVERLSEAVKSNAPVGLTNESDQLRSITMSVFGMLNWFYMWKSHADENARADYARLVTGLSLRGIAGL